MPHRQHLIFGPIDRANAEICRVREAHEKEVSILRARISKSELQIQSLEHAVESKTQENKELLAICDDLIRKMDPHPNA